MAGTAPIPAAKSMVCEREELRRIWQRGKANTMKKRRSEARKAENVKR